MFAAFHRRLVAAPFLANAADSVDEEQLAQNAQRVRSALQSLTKNSPVGLQGGQEVAMDDAAFAQVSAGATIAVDELEKVFVLFEGAITNTSEIRQLYRLPGTCADGTGAPEDCAKLLLSLYMEGFADSYGDYSDQPATLLGALEGDFSCLLYDSGLGYLLAVRSGSGRRPLFWGLDAGSGNTLLISSVKAHLSDFPAGCAYESQQVDGGKSYSRMLNVMRHTPTARAVSTLSKVDSHGHLCGMMFKSCSGRDLTAGAPNPNVF